MQQQSYQFNSALKAKVRVYTIRWRRSQVWLLLVIPLFFLQACFYLLREKIDIIQLGDLLLSPLGLVLKIIFKKPVLTIAHGRDVEFKNFIYQKIMLFSLERIDGVICVSQNLRDRLIKKGIPEAKLAVVPNGIQPEIFTVMPKDYACARLSVSLSRDLNNKRIILSVCRLVRKKGITFFIEKILPRITREINDILYIIAGDGPEKNSINLAVSNLGLKEKVVLLGEIKSKDIIQLLYSAAEVFVMPNRTVQYDAEGFGIVALEAGLCNLPPVAFSVDGLRQAIINGKTGILINENEPDKFAEAVESILKNEKNDNFSASLRNNVIENFSWEKIIDRYIGIYSNVLSKNRLNKDIG